MELHRTLFGKLSFLFYAVWIGLSYELLYPCTILNQSGYLFSKTIYILLVIGLYAIPTCFFWVWQVLVAKTYPKPLKISGIVLIVVLVGFATYCLFSSHSYLITWERWNTEFDGEICSDLKSYLYTLAITHIPLIIASTSIYLYKHRSIRNRYPERVSRLEYTLLFLIYCLSSDLISAVLFIPVFVLFILAINGKYKSKGVLRLFEYGVYVLIAVTMMVNILIPLFCQEMSIRGGGPVTGYFALLLFWFYLMVCAFGLGIFCFLVEAVYYSIKKRDGKYIGFKWGFPYGMIIVGLLLVSDELEHKAENSDKDIYQESVEEISDDALIRLDR